MAVLKMRSRLQTPLHKIAMNIKTTPQQGKINGSITAIDKNKLRAREQLLAIQVYLANTPKKY